jgi:microcystin-dependent protein
MSLSDADLHAIEQRIAMATAGSMPQLLRGTVTGVTANLYTLSALLEGATTPALNIPYGALGVTPAIGDEIVVLRRPRDGWCMVLEILQRSPATSSGDGDAGAPTGAVFPYAGSDAPSGYLLCDGSAVSRTTYADLFAVCGTTYGSGDGSSTFNVPDLRAAFAAGYKSGDANFGTLGGVGGGTAHTHGVGSFAGPAHTHTQPTHQHEETVKTGASFITWGTALWGSSAGNDMPMGSGRIAPTDSSGSAAPLDLTSAAGGDTTGSGGTGAVTGTSASTTAMPPFTTLTYIIKT